VAVVNDLDAEEETIGRILHRHHVEYMNENLRYELQIGERLASVFGEDNGAIELVVRWRALKVNGRDALVIQEFVPTGTAA
jgi:hypothetical protein